MNESSSSTRGEAATKEVADHVCYLFQPIKVEPDLLPETLERRLSDIGAETGTAEVLPKAARKALDDMAVWKSSTLSCSIDLHPQVRRLLGAEQDDKPRCKAGQNDEDKSGDCEKTKAEIGAKVFALTPEARKLLKGLPHKFPSVTSEEQQVPKEQRKPRRLELLLGDAARARLEAALGSEPAEALPILLEDLMLVYFRTGLAIAIVELRCDLDALGGALPSPYLVEAVAALGRLTQLRRPKTKERLERETRVNEKRKEKGRSKLKFRPFIFDLGTLLQVLIGKEGTSPSRRIYCYSFASFAEALAPEERQRMATQLSRRYTADYALEDDLPGTELVQPFANVTQAFGVEGGTTIVDDCMRSDFLSQFATSAVKQVYLPIVLLNYHEFVHLLVISQESGIWPSFKELNQKVIDRLETLTQQVMAFRLFYRFSYVSLVGPHNAVHGAVRTAFQLERILEEVSGDVQEIHELLREVDAERHEARFRFIAVIGAAAGAFLTANGIGAEIVERIPARPQDPPVDRDTAPTVGTSETDTATTLLEAIGRFGAEHEILLTLGLPLLLAVVVSLITWWQLSTGRSAGRGRSLTQLLRRRQRQRLRRR